MSASDGAGDTISATISGPVSGQVAVGKAIHQAQTVGAAPAERPGEDELAALRAAFEALRAEVAAAPEVGEAQKEAAQERLAELEEAVTAPEPDLSTMEYVRNWFAKNLPALAGAVTGLVVSPIVGRLVSAAGDAATTEFLRRFGGAGGGVA